MAESKTGKGGAKGTGKPAGKDAAKDKDPAKGTSKAAAKAKAPAAEGKGTTKPVAAAAAVLVLTWQRIEARNAHMQMMHHSGMDQSMPMPGMTPPPSNR